MSYRSSASFLGLPLVHIASGGVEDGRYRRGVARGWIAIGDIAYGVLFAAGGLSVGGISLGGVSAGLISFGGLALGAVAIGGLAIAEHANDAAANQLIQESPLLALGDSVMEHSQWFVLLALLPALSVFIKRMRRDLP